MGGDPDSQTVGLLRRHPDLRVGINLSMHNLHDYDLAEQICRSLASYRLNPESLLLEITETGVMLDPDQVVETLDELSGMGLKLSVDDFGTGYSSLSYLKKFDIDYLKIDQSFVRDVQKSRRDATILSAVI